MLTFQSRATGNYIHDKPNMTENTENLDEIIITPEMVEAGISTFIAHDPFFYGNEEIVKAIYRAMKTGRAIDTWVCNYGLRSS